MKKVSMVIALFISLYTTSCQPLPPVIPPTPPTTPLDTLCTDVEVNLMFNKIYCQIKDTSTINSNTIWNENIPKYFSINDSSSADWINAPCKGPGQQWENNENRLIYYFQNYWIDNQYNISENGEYGYHLGSNIGDDLYGDNCSLYIPHYGLNDKFCPLFFQDTTYSLSQHKAYGSMLYSELQLRYFIDSVFVIETHRASTEEYFRDTLTYYLVN